FVRLFRGAAVAATQEFEADEFADGCGHFRHERTGRFAGSEQPNADDSGDPESARTARGEQSLHPASFGGSAGPCASSTTRPRNFASSPYGDFAFYEGAYPDDL